jgi:hypothetical protein
MTKVLLISNEVMHYRVSVYNDFARRFKGLGYEFVVRANRLQKKNPHPLEFDFREIPFRFSLGFGFSSYNFIDLIQIRCR